MASHALGQYLFDQTDGFTNENNSIMASSPDRVNLIDGWQKVSKDNERTELIEGKLKELRDQLKLNQPDQDRVQKLLVSQADSASQVAQGSGTQDQTDNKLENLTTMLRRLAGLRVVTTK